MNHLCYHFLYGEFYPMSFKVVGKRIVFLNFNFPNVFETQFFARNGIFVHQRIPFDWKNPIGYIIAFVIQSGSHYFVLQAVIVNLCYFMGVCEFLMAFTRDMDAELVAINECNKTENSEKEVDKRLGDFVKLHGETKEYVIISE